MWFLLVLVIVVLVTVFHLRGQDLGRYDTPLGQSFDTGHARTDEHDAVEASLDVGMGPRHTAQRTHTDIQ